MPQPTTLGKYRIERELGRGGFATVYQAYDPTLDRRVAIKTPHPAYLADAEFGARFRREALLAARLGHPNIITIHEIGEQDGVPFIVMQLVEGATLQTWLVQNRPDPAAALRLLEGVAAALDYAHGRGIIHRDVKPANVIVTPNRSAVLTDFGIARAFDATSHSISAQIGTPRYMAPEQAEGQPLTAACDIYGFGVLLYEVLAGRSPFTGDTPAALLHQQVHGAPPDPCSLNPSLPPAAGRHLLEALAKDPARRPRSARALVRTLLADFEGKPRPRAIWQPVAIAGGLLLVAALIAALVGGGRAARTAGGPDRTPAATLPPLATSVQPATGGANVFVEYIFDASAAMQAPFDSSSRLEVARRVLAEQLRGQPVDANLGLRAFGHRQHFTDRAASCQDVELIAPVQPGQGVRIADWLEQVQAQGLAPLASSLEGAFADFTADPTHRNSVVILSSGVDSCGRDPCAAVQELEARGIHVDVHVIALGVDPEARGQLACIAEGSGGELREAASEAELRQALDEVAAVIAATPTPRPSRSEPTANPPTAPVAEAPEATAAPVERTPRPVLPTASPSGAATRTGTPAAAPTPTRALTVAASPTPAGTPYVEPLKTINVRGGPGMNYPIIGQVQVGDRLTPLASYRNRAENRVWLLICCLPGGRAGWVAAELMSTPPAPLPTPATIPPPPPIPTPTLQPTETPLPIPTATPEKREPPSEQKPPVPTPKP